MPLGVLNVAGYWDPLFELLEHTVNERFLRAEHLATLIVSQDPGALLDELAAYEPRTLDKWLDRRELIRSCRTHGRRRPPSPGRM